MIDFNEISPLVRAIYLLEEARELLNIGPCETEVKQSGLIPEIDKFLEFMKDSNEIQTG